MCSRGKDAPWLKKKKKQIKVKKRWITKEKKQIVKKKKKKKKKNETKNTADCLEVNLTLLHFSIEVGQTCCDDVISFNMYVHNIVCIYV